MLSFSLFLLILLLLSIHVHALLYSPSSGSIFSRATTNSFQGRRLRSRCAFNPKSSSPKSDLDIILERRIPLILETATNASSIPSWLSSLDSNGKWPDSEVNYTTGCDAQRANWPAEYHWLRINTMAAAYCAPLNGTTQYVNNSDMRSAISKAMDWWFQRDFTNPACLDSGGLPACPCGTAGLWNTNWFSNIDLIPTLVAEGCLLMSDVLTDTQHANCSHITLRSYGTFDHNINGVGFLTGANTLDVASIGVDIGLLNNNISIITDAFQRVHNEVVVQNAVHADGIRPDGSFGQHAGLLYNGNYGKDYTNDVLKLELVASGTAFEANSSARSAFASLLDGSYWMIFTNTITKVEHYDFSALPRFISFPVIDDMATGSIKINISQVNDLGHAWNSSDILDVFARLNQSSTTASVGGVTGSRAFWNNDYYVQRGQNYVTTVKGYSSRTLNTECTNTQNPFGFHLSDGALFTYVQGNEYEDIAAAWDWNLIPGITTDYNATPLSCDKARVQGTESFVGGASNGKIGAFAMRYTNPTTKNLTWQKSWFFFDNNIQHVIISNLTSKSLQPVFSVLDQKLHSGTVYVDGHPTDSANFSTFKSLWHSNVGYTFDSSLSGNAHLSVQTGTRSGSWSAIGTSQQPPETVDLFAAWLNHTSTQGTIAYTIYPGMQLSQFNDQVQKESLVNVNSDNFTHAVLDTTSNVLMIVFWAATGGKVQITQTSPQYSVTADHASIVIISQNDWNITVSDPSQKLSALNVQLDVTSGSTPAQWHGQQDKTLTFTLPSGGLAGQSASQQIS